MARDDRAALDTPRSRRRQNLDLPTFSREGFGRGAEAFARFMGTPTFLVWMTLICVGWLTWNTLAPEALQFDPRALNFTLLTLMLSLQASYAAPLILLAENRSADRARVEAEEDRQQAARTLADTEYLAREVAAIRIAMRDMATRDFLRSELRSLVDELAQELAGDERSGAEAGGKKNKKKAKRPAPAADGAAVPPADGAAVPPRDEPAATGAAVPPADGTTGARDAE